MKTPEATAYFPPPQKTNKQTNKQKTGILMGLLAILLKS